MEEALIKRILPHSIEAEQSVIGSMLMGREAIMAASEILTSDDFYQHQYGVIFDAMVELFNEGKPVDLVTLQNRLREKDVPPEISSMEFVRDLLNAVPTSANVRHYANIVSEKAVLRRLIKLTEEIENDCYLNKEPVEVIMEELDEDAMRKVTERIIELGDKKELVTQEDLPYIVSDVLKHGAVGEKVKLKSYFVNLAHGLKPMATLKIEINGKEYEESSGGDGQYDAFVRALRKIYKVTLGRKFPMLTNYAVTIPPGGRTDAFVQTVITWSYDEQVFRTRGLDADQTEAAIKATMKMLNLIEDEYEKE